jgi:hypothetical protein
MLRRAGRGAQRGLDSTLSVDIGLISGIETEKKVNTSVDMDEDD